MLRPSPSCAHDHVRSLFLLVVRHFLSSFLVLRLQEHTLSFAAASKQPAAAPFGPPPNRHAQLLAALPPTWTPSPPDVPAANIIAPHHLYVDRVPVGDGDSIHVNEITDLYDILFEYNRLWTKQRWMNTITMQNPVDAWVIQEILFDTQPDVIVETGTMNGGGALFYASLMKMYMDVEGRVPAGGGAGGGTKVIKRKPRVITVGDVALDNMSYGWHWSWKCPDNCRNATTNPLWDSAVTFFQGDALSEEVYGRVVGKLKEIEEELVLGSDSTSSRSSGAEDEDHRSGLKVMVVLDSAHHHVHVRKELALYAPLVTAGQYLLVQDTHLDKLRNLKEPGKNWEGAFAAIREFFWYSDFARRNFKIDQSREYFIFTQHKSGFLKRLKEDEVVAADNEKDSTVENGENTVTVSSTTADRADL